MAKRKNITTTQLALMTAAAVISLRGLPMMAQEELTMFFYIFFATFLFLIPAALCFAFGEVVSDRRQGRAIRWAMTVIFILCVAVVMWAENRGNPHLLTMGADSSLNMEGKESRLGIQASRLNAVINTADT